MSGEHMPPESTSTISRAIGPYAARKCCTLFTTRTLLAVRSIPWLRKTCRSIVWTRLEMVTTSMPPIRSTAVGPIWVSTPAFIGPSFLKVPSDSIFTTAVALTGLHRLLHSLGIEDRAVGHVLDLGIEQRLQHRRRVVVAAATRIVGTVGDHQRALLADAGLGGRDAVGARVVSRRRERLVAALPYVVDQCLRDRLGARLGAGLVADGDRGPGVGNVG